VEDLQLSKPLSPLEGESIIYRTYAVTAFEAHSAYGSMVRYDQLCAIFRAPLRKIAHHKNQESLCRGQKTLTAFVL
jgi:hypothetical protein